MRSAGAFHPRGGRPLCSLPDGAGELCALTFGEKRLLTVPNAGHGMSYMADKTAYLRAVSAFLDDVFRRKKGETGEKTQ